MDLVYDETASLQACDDQRLFFLAVHEVDHPILILDQNRVIQYANRAFFELFQYAAAEVIGQCPSDILAGPDTNAEVLKQLRHKAWGSEGFHDEVLFRGKDGRGIWVAVNVKPICEENGVARNLVVALMDITETMRIHELQQLVLEAVASGRPLAEIADLICRQVEVIAPEVVSSMVAVDDEGRLHPLAGPRLPESYSAALEGQPIGETAGSCGTAAFLGIPVCVTDIETDPLWEEYRSLVEPMGLLACWSLPIQSRDGRVVGTFAFYYQEKRAPSALHKKLVSACVHLCMLAIEREEAKQKIEQLSHFDALTGLPNRTAFYEMAVELVSRVDGEQITFLAIDLNHFNDINNTLGYSVGDRILIEVAYRLRKLAQPRGIISRTEGDSFILAIPGGSVAKAAALADSIIELLKVPIELQETTLPISARVGISITETGNPDPRVYAEQAITATFRDGASDQEAYRFYSSEMNQMAQDRLLFGTALRTAIEKGTLRLHYQPQVRLATGALTGVEALLRWNDERFGEIPPKKFIPLAEDAGLSEDFGQWALQEACRQMAQWRERGIPIPTVSVNLSPLHFRNHSLPWFVDDLLRRYNLPPRCLTIEITENDMMARNPQSLESIKALHELGLWMSVDDFGTGFSSLSRLTQFPINELKLDSSFICDLEKNENARALATAVIRIGQSLKMNIISEGVETAGQARLLLELGCDVAQGFLYARPMSVHELEQWIVSRKPVDLSGDQNGESPKDAVTPESLLLHP
ncbi:EAL domain-containing protein [Granulicella sp. WH15]|uniref:EAL domain-containing protein n=1 Tax=Granulicella sp. WH15 TaxID=2602070 RepID=UPI001366F6C8|nr:EAL domain-containing protein [Granulicella sp. WH15]QHN05114.1 EAL domain-containing protein [Granulicella sp. WH15]